MAKGEVRNGTKRVLDMMGLLYLFQTGLGYQVLVFDTKGFVVIIGWRSDFFDLHPAKIDQDGRPKGHYCDPGQSRH